jgi:ABC-type transport system substrate-binding protein
VGSADEERALRQALSMAIDRNLIADKVFNGTVTLLPDGCLRWSTATRPAPAVITAFDVAKAKAAYDGRRLQGHVDDDLQRRQRHQQGYSEAIATRSRTQ